MELHQIPLRSYPTYEEWKQALKEDIIVEEKRSYPTYEEWKLSSKEAPVFSTTLFLSYL